MRKATKAERVAVESLKAYAADATKFKEAWQAVWDVCLDDGFWVRDQGIVWFAMYNGVSQERRLIPCGLQGEITAAEVAYRYGHGPQPPQEDRHARDVALRLARARAEYLDDVTRELRQVAPRVVELLAQLASRINDTAPVV